MRLEHYSVEKLKKEIASIIGTHLDLNSYRIFFFGSRVSGKGNERSDIDVGIDGIIPVPASALLKIKEEINSIPTLYKIDVIDFKSSSEDFRSVALKFTENI
jgi:uncharacterized protein